MPNSNSRMVKPSPNGAQMISTKRVGTTQAPRSRGVDKVVTQTQLVGKDTLAPSILRLPPSVSSTRVKTPDSSHWDSSNNTAHAEPVTVNLMQQRLQEQKEYY